MFDPWRGWSIFPHKIGERDAWLVVVQLCLARSTCNVMGSEVEQSTLRARKTNSVWGCETVLLISSYIKSVETFHSVMAYTLIEGFERASSNILLLIWNVFLAGSLFIFKAFSSPLVQSSTWFRKVLRGVKKKRKTIPSEKWKGFRVGPPEMYRCWDWESNITKALFRAAIKDNYLAKNRTEQKTGRKGWHEAKQRNRRKLRCGRQRKTFLRVSVLEHSCFLATLFFVPRNRPKW